MRFARLIGETVDVASEYSVKMRDRLRRELPRSIELLANQIVVAARLEVLEGTFAEGTVDRIQRS